MEQAKSLLEVKQGKTFLDIIAGQVLELRKEHGARLPLVLMNSFATRDDTLARARAAPGAGVRRARPTSCRTRSRRSRVDDRFPVEWPDDPQLEWCPPGHGDVYTALQTSGTLEALLDARLRVRVPLELRQPRRGARPAGAELVRGRGAPVRDGGVREDARRPQGRPPGGAQGDRPAGAARDRADARGGPREVRRHRHLEVLQHQQPVGQPARAGQGAATTTTACSACR